MARNSTGKFLAAAALWCFLFVAAALGGETVTLLLIGDTHQDHRNLPAVRARIEKTPEPKALLAAGDHLCHLYPEGNRRNPPAFRQIRSREALLALDRQCFAELGGLGIAAAVPGNHEPDRGEAYFLALYRQHRIPLVAVNYPGIADEFLIIHGIGIVGLPGHLRVYPEWRDRARPDRARLLAAARAARAAGAKSVILLSHQPDAEDEKLAADPEFQNHFDLICGGDSHRFIPPPDTPEQIVATPHTGPIPILKAGSHFRGLATATLEFENQTLQHIRLKTTLLTTP